MASVASLVGQFTSVDGTKVASGTPSAGALIVIATAHTSNLSDTPPTDNNSDGLGTYVQAVAAVKDGGVDKLAYWVREAFIGDAVATDFTHAPGATSGGGLRVFSVTGMPSGRVGALAIRQVGHQDNQVGPNTPAPAFDEDHALTENPCLGTVFNGSNPSGMTIPSGWTAIGGDAGYGSPNTGRRDAARSSGETGQTITWGSSSASNFCSALLELDTSELPPPPSGGAAVRVVSSYMRW